MRVSRLVAPGRSELVEAPDPAPGPDEILIEVRACGVCASELHPWRDGDWGFPLRLGHEPAGIVRAIGAGVRSVAPGDRVTGFFAPAFSDLALAEEWQLAKIPDGVAFEQALGEPLACLVNALRRSRVAVGDRVAIVGVGFMGLGLLAMIRALRGPREIIAVDPRPEARARALSLGADRVYAPEDLPDELLLLKFKDWDGPTGCDVVVEGSGTQDGLTLAGRMVRAQGVLSVMGWHQGGPRQVDAEMWGWKAIDVVNAHMRKQIDKVQCLRIGLDLIAVGRYSLAPLVTHTYGLDDVDRAFGHMLDKPKDFVKAVIRLGE